MKKEILKGMSIANLEELQKMIKSELESRCDCFTGKSFRLVFRSRKNGKFYDKEGNEV